MLSFKIPSTLYDELFFEVARGNIKGHETIVMGPNFESKFIGNRNLKIRNANLHDLFDQHILFAFDIFQSLIHFTIIDDELYIFDFQKIIEEAEYNDDIPSLEYLLGQSTKSFKENLKISPNAHLSLICNLKSSSPLINFSNFEFKYNEKNEDHQILIDQSFKLMLKTKLYDLFGTWESVILKQKDKDVKQHEFISNPTPAKLLNIQKELKNPNLEISAECGEGEDPIINTTVYLSDLIFKLER